MAQKRAKNSRQLITALVAAAMLAGAPAAAAPGRDKTVDYAKLDEADLARAGAQALRKGDAKEAINAFSELVSRNPRDGNGQALLALSWHLAAANSPQAVELAMTGYDLAMRVEPGQMWPAAMAGRAAWERGSFDEAAEYFARAVTLRPNDARLLGALSAAAYMGGDTGLAGAATDRAAALAPQDPAMLRLAAIVAAANGRADAANAYVDRLAAIAPDAAAAAGARVSQLQATAPLDANVQTAAEDPAPPEEAPSQISVDIAIVLSQNTHRERTGINLLDGLSLQFGANRTDTRSFRRTDGSPSTVDYQRVVTGAIGIPQLNYSLNLFNRGGQFYSVVARPQLTAYRGEQSEFFALTTFRQKVVATAEIRFGETLLLSGLNETVDDRTFSKTPVLGDIPIAGALFSQKNKTQRRDAVLVLVTPSRPASLPGRAFVRGDHAARLAELWTTLVDPMSDAAATRARLGRMPFFTRMTRGDVSMPFPAADQAASEMLRDLLLPGSQ